MLLNKMIAAYNDFVAQDGYYSCQIHSMDEFTEYMKSFESSQNTYRRVASNSSFNLNDSYFVFRDDTSAWSRSLYSADDPTELIYDSDFYKAYPEFAESAFLAEMLKDIEPEEIKEDSDDYFIVLEAAERIGCDDLLCWNDDDGLLEFQDESLIKSILEFWSEELSQ